jgi:hypothetical protein
MYCITRRGARARELLHFGKRLCSAGKPGRMGRAWPRAGRKHPIDRAAAEQVALETRTHRRRGGGAAEWQIAVRGQLGAAAGRRSGRRDAAQANADDLPRLHFARAQPGRRDSPCCPLIRVSPNPAAQNGAAVFFGGHQQEPGRPITRASSSALAAAPQSRAPASEDRFNLAPRPVFVHQASFEAAEASF